MNVLNLEPKNYSHKAISIWKKHGYKYDESSWSELREINSKSNADIIIVRLERYISIDELSYFPNLKYIISSTTGNTHLDVNLIKKLNIKLILLKNHFKFLNSISSTSEFAWGLLLSLIKKIPSANNHVKNFGWNRDLFIGNQLKGKNIGIIGLGRTGLKVAEYALAFNMKVFFFDPHVNNEKFNKIVDFNQILKTCDILSFHVHLSDETFHMINEKNIAFINNNALLINTSRGEIIDEKIIVEAIASGKVKGFATDVIENEFSNIKDNPLVNLMRDGKNVIITPHIAGASYDAMRECEVYLTEFFITNNLIK